MPTPAAVPPDLAPFDERAAYLKNAVAQGLVSAAMRVLRASPVTALSASALLRRGVALAEARDVVALETGFADWSRLRDGMDVGKLRADGAPAALIEAALAGDDARAQAIIDRWPDLPARSRPCALALGHESAADGWSKVTANEPFAPTGWPPLLHLLNSRYSAADQAVNGRRLAIADALLAQGADANAGLCEADSVRGYRTALGAAIGRVRSPALAKLLLANGADIADGPTLYEGSAMWEAVRWRDVESLRALLAAGPPQWHVCHALPHALVWNDEDLTRLLLANNGDPNWSMGAWGCKGNCLHEAVVLNVDPPVLNALLEHGANVDQPDRDGRTPLAIATCLNRRALAALLRRRSGGKGKPDGVRPLDRWVAACLDGKEDLARQRAAKHTGKPDAVDILHNRAATKEERAAARAQLASCFRAADHLWLCRAIARRTPNAPPVLAAATPGVVRLLLAGGLDPDIADDDGERPLHLAAAAGDRLALDALLAAGADTGATNFANQTPLDAALDAGQHGMAQTLARHGGVCARNPADLGFNAAFERAADAVVNGDIDTLRRLLRERPALAAARSRRPHRCTLLNYLGANGFEHWRQKTPANAVEVIDLLLAAGSDPNAVCYTYRGGPGENTAGLLTSSDHPRKAGLTLDMVSALARGGMRQDAAYQLLTALHDRRGGEAVPNLDPDAEAARQALLESAALGEREIVHALLDAGVDVNSRRADGATALHQAAFHGNDALAEQLLARGADATLRDNVFDGNAAGWARAGGFEALAESLAAAARAV